ILTIFFFSSRRRHTRCLSDWSSDVCSSDLFAGKRVLIVGAGKMADLAARVLHADGAALAVTNRTRARAEELAARLGATVEGWEQDRKSVVEGKRGGAGGGGGLEQIEVVDAG